MEMIRRMGHKEPHQNDTSNSSYMALGTKEQHCTIRESHETIKYAIISAGSHDFSLQYQQHQKASKIFAGINITKAIVGAGSFALPRVFRENGILGGTFSIMGCGILAFYTITSLSHSRCQITQAATSAAEMSVTSYVELSRVTLGGEYATLVFILTICASLGVCSSYLVFLGQTLEGLSFDIESNNIISILAPNTKEILWEILIAMTWVPLAMCDYSVFAFTSTFGVLAVVGGLFVTVFSGIYSEPGLGFAKSIEVVAIERPYFRNGSSSSFGTVAFLFCVHFLIFPILNSMANPKEEFPWAARWAITITAITNMIFAAICYGFYGEETSDLVLDNLGNGPYLSALKLLLCVDLFFTFPVVFQSGKQIVEHALIISSSSLNTDDKCIIDNITISSNSGEAATDAKLEQEREKYNNVRAKRLGISFLGVFICFLLAQLGNFGDVVNLVGGVAQATLAFIMPPAIAIALDLRKQQEQKILNGGLSFDKVKKYSINITVFLFGVYTVISTTWHSISVNIS